MAWVRDPPNLENTKKNFGGFSKTFVFIIRAKTDGKKALKLFSFGGGYCAVSLTANMS